LGFASLIINLAEEFDMNPLLQKYLLVGALLLVIIITGFWVSRSGKPINIIKMNIHKLIALGTAVFIGLTMYRLSQGIRFGSLEIIALVASIVFAVAAIVTGGLASLAKPIRVAVIIHKIMPYLTILSTAATLYLLAGAG
jgi:ABC-type multidrug transport system permease subunit